MVHLEASLQRDIDLIRGKIQEMARLGEQALSTCLKALQESNRQLAYSVILRDRYIDDLEKQIDRLCLEFIVRQQPVAGHLRFVYSTIKINAELERIGDYAESIARQILKLHKFNLKPFHGQLVEIANRSIPMLHSAVQSFVDQKPELARKTMDIEEGVDVLRNQVNAVLIQAHHEQKIPVEALTPLLTIARRLERVSDQARPRRFFSRRNVFQIHRRWRLGKAIPLRHRRAFMAMSMHLHVISTQIARMPDQMKFGCAAVLIMLILFIIANPRT